MCRNVFLFHRVIILSKIKDLFTPFYAMLGNSLVLSFRLSVLPKMLFLSQENWSWMVFELVQVFRFTR